MDAASGDKPEINYVYDTEASIQDKVLALAQKVYNADRVTWAPDAQEEAQGLRGARLGQSSGLHGEDSPLHIGQGLPKGPTVRLHVHRFRRAGVGGRGIHLSDIGIDRHDARPSWKPAKAGRRRARQHTRPVALGPCGHARVLQRRSPRRGPSHPARPAKCIGPRRGRSNGAGARQGHGGGRRSRPRTCRPILAPRWTVTP